MMDRIGSLRWWQFGLRHLALLVLVVAVACWWFLQRPGGRQDTGNALDVAIDGRGYFICTHPVTNLTLYTRKGNLSLNSQGQMCVGPNRECLVLEPNISIPSDATNVFIQADGDVQYFIQGQTQPMSAGQITLATFINPHGLRPSLPTLPGFLEQTEDSGLPMITQPGASGAGWLCSTFLETPLADGLDATQWLLVVLCSLVGWLAWEVRGLGTAIRRDRTG